ncbi:MAG: FAD-dependent oxidoreductase [Candidatus Saccharibacteria bacterium]|nr:FAD-dependent oxidoreductase [Candidatus Saccharibacteria bacterium]
MAYYIKLLKKEVVARDTMAFYWEKPEGFEFIAGQNGDFALIEPPETDEKGDLRTFSFVGAPFEENLVTATRMRNSAFKHVLKNLPIGTEVKMAAPHDDFKLHKTATTPAVFLIGGIGITPIRSIIADATHNHLPHKITLIYSNRTPSDAAFTDDLQEYAKTNQNFTFVPVFTDKTVEGRNGERGHIDSEMVKKYVTDIETPIYYLSGPPEMVKSMRNLLIEIGANEDNIRSEEFDGY